jgi:hypothetical protein
MSRLERLRWGPGFFLLYPLLALLSFPTFGTLIAGEHGLGYVLDVFELPRSGVLADWLANGLTLWNTHVTAGNALLAQDAISPLAADVGLAFVVGPFGAYAIVAWLLPTAAGISMHLFLRDSLRLSTVAAVGGAAMYLFGFWHYIYGFSALAAPLVLWLVDRALVPAPGRWRFVVGGALVGAALFYDGQSQVVLILAVVQLGYVLATTTAREEVAARLAMWAGTWILALALYGPVLLTQLVALPLSQRTIWDLRALYDPRPIEAIRDTVLHYSATFLGAPTAGGLGISPGRYGTYFLGAIGLPLLLLGIVSAKRGRRERFLLVLLAAIPLIDLVAVLLTPLQDQLGFLKSFQFVRIRHLFPMALVANAALGLDIVASTLSGRRPRLWTGRWRGLVLTAGMVPLGVTLIVAFWNVYRLRHGLLQMDSRAIGWALLLLAVGGGAAAIAGLVAVTIARRRPGAAIGRGAAVSLALLLLLAGERAVYAHGERLVGSNIGTWADHLAETPGQTFLLRQPGIAVDRVLTFGEDANRMGAIGLLQADGNQAVYPVTYHAFFGALIQPQLAVDPPDATYFGSWGNRAITFGRRVNPELVALVGARWLYVKGNEIPTVPGIVARFHDGDVTVYEVPSVLPRAFLAGQLRTVPDAAALRDHLAAADLSELRDAAFVAAGPDADSLAATGIGARPGSGPAGSASITVYSPDRVDVTISADRPAVLVLTDVMAPGWTAERDGQSVPITTIDGTFRGVAVDQTTRIVVFRYRPWFTTAGAALAVLGLGLAFAWGAWLRRRDRRAIARSATLPSPTGPPEARPGEPDA